jgi:hypothetical protein
MRRREFVVGLGATAWPVAARAQRQPMPVIGFLKRAETWRLITVGSRTPAFRAEGGTS